MEVAISFLRFLTVFESGSAVPEHMALVTARLPSHIFYLFIYLVVKNVQ